MIEAPALAKTVAGKKYVFPKNPQAIEAITLTPAGDDGRATEIAVVIDGAEQRVAVSGRDWVRGDLNTGPSAGQVAVAGGWTAADTFTLDMVRYRTPFTARYRLIFSGDELKVETKPNVGPTPPVMVGKRG
jgi:hypothetical protein